MLWHKISDYKIFSTFAQLITLQILKHEVKMGTEGVTQVIKNQLLQLAPSASGNKLIPYKTVVHRNPFKSLLEMVTCYHDIYQSRDIDRLKAFLSLLSKEQGAL